MPKLRRPVDNSTYPQACGWKNVDNFARGSLINTKDKNQNKDGNENQETGAEAGPGAEAETGNRNSSDQIAKVTITKKAEHLMSELVSRVNDGFEFGRLNRHQLMSWILSKFAEECSETEIRTIRGDHFDDMALLELSLKRFKQSGGLPPDLKKMLLAQAGWEDAAKKSSKKLS